ncbi:MlaD family protein [Mycolicibacterium sp. P9-22]|uniref:MlaD family protein n=1 Tax=Mycolicibacterium sp. P9-22 TaxID=2024613 RepID=UPI001D1517BF|nr:MlaD family protein [Mycolicibacterium sp. P9-22]
MAAALVAAAAYFVVNPFSQKKDVLSVTVETTFVGQGVAAGTPVIMHGVKIGEVTAISSMAGGGVRLKADLQKAPTRGLTDAMAFDYRPSNYFGVTGINITPVADGQPLRDGTEINTAPKGNYSLQTLLYRFGELSNGVFDQRLVTVIDRATRYADGLNPLLETVLVVAESVAVVQTVSTEQLLRNTTGISVAFPGYIEALAHTGDMVLNTVPNTLTPDTAEEIEKKWNYFPALGETAQRVYRQNVKLWLENRDNDVWFDNHLIPTMTITENELFTPVGVLLSSHVDDLFPVVESARALTDTVPKALSADAFASTVTEIRSRFERMYAGSGEQRALQVRVILDQLPGVAATLGSIMGQPS